MLKKELEELFITLLKDKTNNKYMKSCDDIKLSIYITHLDANNLYDWPMSQYLSYSDFKWLNKKEVDKFDVNLIAENSLNRYISNCMVHYMNCIMVIN